MNTTRRTVPQLPLRCLWRDDGFTTASRGRSLSADDITQLLRLSRVQFVVVDVGKPPHWISSRACFDFWKTEGRNHVVAPDSRVALDQCPDGYFYFASQWNSPDATTPIVVLEKYH